MNYFLEGFFLQASLIMALGAQNIFVLESGLKKQHHILVALVSSICDTVLIAVGVMGAATIFIELPFIKIFFGVLGGVFLIYYGIKKILESFVYSENNKEFKINSIDSKRVFFITIGFSLLNPHVYLDTVVLIGGYSSRLINLHDRLIFGLGAATFSSIWFFGLSCFSFFLSNFLNDSKRMRCISFISGIILILLSFKLGFEVYSWKL